jgi:hypothetical protein
MNAPASIRNNDSERQLLPEPGRSNKATAPVESPSHIRNGWNFNFFKAWGLECLSMIGAVLCQAGIVGVLASMDGRPLDSWTIVVSLNAVVAILTTASKSLLLLPVTECISQFKWSYFDSRPRQMFDLDIFDNASRGPLGALMLLLRKQTMATLATIGAIVILASLAVDPFVQQVIHFETRLVPMGDGTATFPLATTIDSGATRGDYQATNCKFPKPSTRKQAHDSCWQTLLKTLPCERR